MRLEIDGLDDLDDLEDEDDSLEDDNVDPFAGGHHVRGPPEPAGLSQRKQAHHRLRRQRRILRGGYLVLVP